MVDVTLLDGRTVNSSSHEWLVECRDREIEARKVLEMPNREMRRGYLAGVGRDRGAEAQARLEAAITGLWGRRQARRAASTP